MSQPAFGRVGFVAARLSPNEIPRARTNCTQANGAGKSTLIKLLTGEMEPQEGIVWKHPNTRVAYVAQHAFHHVEQVHQSRTQFAL